MQNDFPLFKLRRQLVCPPEDGSLFSRDHEKAEDLYVNINNDFKSHNCTNIIRLSINVVVGINK